MKTDKEDMLKTYNEFKALCLEKGYEFKFEGIQEYINGKYAVLRLWEVETSHKIIDAEWEIQEYVGDDDVLTTMNKLYQKGIDHLIKYG